MRRSCGTAWPIQAPNRTGLPRRARRRTRAYAHRQAECVAVRALDPQLLHALVDYKSRSVTSSRRMEPIQDYCVTRLHMGGLTGVVTEETIRVAYKRKKWDVVKVGSDGRPELAITCRSIMSNHGGTVPNRID